MTCRSQFCWVKNFFFFFTATALHASMGRGQDVVSTEEDSLFLNVEQACFSDVSFHNLA